jgi:ATP-dependent Clp protease ATP-binding subunit ClpB
MLQTFVTADAIASIVSKQTGIPMSRMNGNDIETYQLLHMEQTLQQRVIGQDHVLQSLSNCIRLARTKLHDKNHTLGNFLLLGPTVRPNIVIYLTRRSKKKEIL